MLGYISYCNSLTDKLPMALPRSFRCRAYSSYKNTSLLFISKYFEINISQCY